MSVLKSNFSVNKLPFTNYSSRVHRARSKYMTSLTPSAAHACAPPLWTSGCTTCSATSGCWITWQMEVPCILLIQEHLVTNRVTMMSVRSHAGLKLLCGKIWALAAVIVISCSKYLCMNKGSFIVRFTINKPWAIVILVFRYNRLCLASQVRYTAVQTWMYVEQHLCQHTCSYTTQACK